MESLTVGMLCPICAVFLNSIMKNVIILCWVWSCSLHFRKLHRSISSFFAVFFFRNFSCFYYKRRFILFINNFVSVSECLYKHSLIIYRLFVTLNHRGMQRTQFVLYEISSLVLPRQLVCIQWYNVFLCTLFLA